MTPPSHKARKIKLLAHGQSRWTRATIPAPLARPVLNSQFTLGLQTSQAALHRMMSFHIRYPPQAAQLQTGENRSLILSYVRIWSKLLIWTYTPSAWVLSSNSTPRILLILYSRLTAAHPLFVSEMLVLRRSRSGIFDAIGRSAFLLVHSTALRSTNPILSITPEK